MSKPPIGTRQFLLIFTVNLFIFFAFQMLVPTLPVYIKDLGGSNIAVGWINGILTISALIVRPLAGLALDRTGRRGILLGGLIIILVITFSYRLFPIVALLLVVRFLHGIGWGMASTASSTIATDAIPKARFGEGMGYFSFSSNAAMAFAPGLGLIVFSVFHIDGLVYGSLTFGVAALILTLFLSYRKIEKSGYKGMRIVPYEASSIKPSLVIFCVTATFGAVVGFISLYSMSLGIKNIGLFFLVFAVTLIITRPVFGKLVDDKGYSIVVYPGLILLGAALTILIRASTLDLFLLTAVIYGIGYGAVQASLQAVAVVKAPAHRLGAANATFITGVDGGIGFGSIIAGVLSQYLGYRAMFFAFTFFPLLGAVLYFALLKNDPFSRDSGP